MIREHSRGGMLMDEFTVQVFTGGRVNWDRLGAFLRRNPAARRQLSTHLGRAGSRHGRRSTVAN